MHILKYFLAALFIATNALAQSSLPSPHYKNLTVDNPINVGAMPAFTGGDCTSIAGTVNLSCNTPSPSATVATYYVSPAGNDANDGLTINKAKATLQAAVNAANPNGKVIVSAGIYALTAGLNVKPGVEIACQAGAIITQANGANVPYLIDADASAAHKFNIHDCTIDHNAANNTLNLGYLIIYGGSSNDIKIERNYIKNCVGLGIQIKDGTRFRIRNNDFSGTCYVAPIAIGSSVVSQTLAHGEITGNTIEGSIGQHAIIVNRSDNNIIAFNKINASITTNMVVNTSGTSVSWVSGPTFSNLFPGQFLTINSGVEYLIASVNSATSITLSTSAGTNSGIAAVGGPGDLISIGSASYTNVSNNMVTGGGAGGIVLSNNIGIEDNRGTIVANNVLTGQAQSCIGASTINNGSYLDDTLITGNIVTNCGQGKTAVAPVSRSGFGFAAFGAAPSLFARMAIIGNHCRDLTGALHQYCIAIDGSSTPSAGSISAGKNDQVGAVNDGIQNAISSIVPAAGWGVGNSVSNIKSWGDGFVFTITSGTGTGALPAVTINTTVTNFENSPIIHCDIQNSSNLTSAYGMNNSGRAGQTLLYQGTPPASTAHTFYCRG